MTAQVPPSVDFGDINDLLRQANGESTETFVWKCKRQQVKERSGSGEEDNQEPTHCTSKENKEEKGPGAVSRPVRQKEKAKRKAQKPETDKDDKGGHASRPSFLQTSHPDPTESKATDKDRTRHTHSDCGHDNFMESVKAFDCHQGAFHRHVVILPDRLYNNLLACYGERSLSAVLCVLARAHVERHKEAMRQMLTDRIDLY